MAHQHLGDNEFIFSMDQLTNPSAATTYNEQDLLEKDEQYYFSRDQYFSSVKRGVVELDEKVFKIYTQSLLHYKRGANTTSTKEDTVKKSPIINYRTNW